MTRRRRSLRGRARARSPIGAIALAALLLLGAPPARADDPKPSPPAPPPALNPALNEDQAADAVLAAVKAKDDAALSALAGKDDPDPWFVADTLVGRGELDAAERFAAAAPRKDVERLPDFVRTERTAPTSAARRSALAAAFGAIRAGDAKAALETLDREAAKADGAVGTNVDLVGARTIAARALALRGLTRLEESAVAFRASAEASRKIGWWAGAAGGLEESGLSAVQRSDYATALAAWEEELPLREALGHPKAIARVIGFLGNVHYSRGDFLRSLEFLERSLKMQEEAGDEKGVASTVGNIGGVYNALGNFPRALEYQERALTLRERIGDRALIASTLGNLGTVRASLGEYAKALELHERALAMAESLGDKSRMAKTLGSMGVLEAEFGNLPRSLELHTRALRLREEIGDRAGAAQSLGNVGLVERRMGDPTKAMETLTRALKQKEALGDRWGAASTLGSLGTTWDELGDHAKALESFERCHALFTEVKDRSGAARALASIGMQRLEGGDPAKALPVLERAAREAERLRATPILVEALRGVVEARLRTGDAGRALADARRGVSLLEPLLGGLGEQEGASGRERYASLFALGTLAAARLNETGEVAFFLESGRAGSLLEALGGRRALRWQALPEDLRRAEAAAKAAESVALADYSRALEGDDRAAIQAKDDVLIAARARLLEVVARIQREARKQADVFYPRAATLEEIEGGLAAGDALVLYGVFPDEALAFVVTHEGARVVPLGGSEDLTAACEAVPWSRPEADPTGSIDALRKRIVAPLALPPTIKRVLVSPDGPLSFVPLGVLFDDRSIALVQSGTTFGVLAEERGKRGDGVLALGDPDYGSRAVAKDGSSDRGMVLTPLPGTRAEVAAIGTLTLLGKEASVAGLEAAVAAKKGRWHAVHLACHGRVDPERPAFCSLALSPDAEHEGFLTALDVLGMDMAADVVVLSACETGKGKIVKGEGIVGLMRAFMFAGAPRVICSLWKVDDDATRALMTKFYELWNPKTDSQGLGTAEALRRAQEFVRSQEKWKHPYYWAAWVLWGLPD